MDEIITIDRAALKSGNPLKILPEFFGLLRRLRGGKFSLAVDFQGYGETAWLARLSGAPQRWGSVYSKGRALGLHARPDAQRKNSSGGLESVRCCNNAG